MEEKYQKILKDCQKKPENKGCFDCVSRGNQYVVLNFNTFVCTTCSGIHREMQHKIKSVGMSTFSIDEIKAVAAGGNAVAKASWMAKHGPNDPQMPSEGETDKIRSFIKAKYQAKRWWSDTPAPVEAAPPPAQPVSAVVPNAPKLQLGTPTPAVAPAPAPAQPTFGAFDVSDPAPAPAPPPAPAAASGGGVMDLLGGLDMGGPPAPAPAQQNFGGFGSPAPPQQPNAFGAAFGSPAPAMLAEATKMAQLAAPPPGFGGGGGDPFGGMMGSPAPAPAPATAAAPAPK